MTPRIFVLQGAPRSVEQKLMIALLDTGPDAIVSHDSAAALWGLPGYRLLPAHVTRFRDTVGRDLSDTVVHQARHLPADQVTSLQGFAVTRPERVPFDLANRRTPNKRVERAVDRLWSDRLVSGRSLRRVLFSLPKRGFRGTALMRTLLDERGDDWIPPASGLEGRAMDVFARNGFDGYERQLDLGGDEWVGRVDFVHRQRRIVVEVQSDRHHAALSSQRDDELRFERLGHAGFAVVEVWEHDLWHQPMAFIQRLRAVEARNGPTGG